MSKLLQGMESKRKIAALISLTSLRAESTIDGFYSYYCNGVPFKTTIALHGLTQGNFSRDCKVLEQAMAVVTVIEEEDWERFKSEK